MNSVIRVWKYISMISDLEGDLEGDNDRHYTTLLHDLNIWPCCAEFGEIEIGEIEVEDVFTGVSIQDNTK